MDQQIILLGLKHSGKTTVGNLLSSQLSLSWFDLDSLIEAWYLDQKPSTPDSFPLEPKKNSFFPRQIVTNHGTQFFQHCEYQALHQFLSNHQLNHWILSTGGGIMVNKSAMALLAEGSFLPVYLRAPESVLFERIVKKGLPSYLEGSTLDESKKLWHTVYRERDQILQHLIHQQRVKLVIECDEDPPTEILNKLLLALP